VLFSRKKSKPEFPFWILNQTRINSRSLANAGSAKRVLNPRRLAHGPIVLRFEFQHDETGGFHPRSVELWVVVGQKGLNPRPQRCDRCRATISSALGDYF